MAHLLETYQERLRSFEATYLYINCGVEHRLKISAIKICSNFHNCKVLCFGKQLAKASSSFLAENC